MENVIFLDIDGVLNHGFPETQNTEIRDDGMIEKDKVELLSRLVKSTGAKLVLHSGWRFWFDESMKPCGGYAQILAAALEGQGLTLYDKTPDLTTPEIRRTKRFSRVKAQEILLWAGRHEPDNWVVLDDLPLGDAQVEAHQVRTDAAVGLTWDDVRKAEKLLTKKES